MRFPDTGRGVHPCVRPTSHRHWVFDEFDKNQTVLDLSSDTTAKLDGSLGSRPFIINGPVGPKAKRFEGAETLNKIDATSVVAHRDNDFTVSIWCRIRAYPTTSTADYIYYYGGEAQDTGAPGNNALFSIGMQGTGSDHKKILLNWEHGAGVNVITVFDFIPPLNEWFLLTITKSNITGVGPAGTCDVALYINGAGSDVTTGAVEVITGVVNASDGGSPALYVIGGLIDSAGTGTTSHSTVDIAGVYTYTEALPQEEIEADFRRGRMLPFFTRVDARLEIPDQAGNIIDLTDLEGYDWVESIDISDSIDNAVITGKATLTREIENLSLAYLKTDTRFNLSDLTDPESYDPLLDFNKTLEVRAALVPLGLTANQSELKSILRGPIDDIDWGSGEQITVNWRDDGGRLIETYIEQEAVYGSPGGTAVEGEMQDILDDNSVTNYTGSYTSPTLLTPESPLWLILEYQQKREPVLTALRTLASQIGWDCRYLYSEDPDVDDWRLTFYEPNRDQVYPDVTFAQSEMKSITRASLGTSGVRNVIRIVYPSSETSDPVPLPLGDYGLAGVDSDRGWVDLDGKGNRSVAYYTLEFTGSITKFGRRLFMEVQESSSSQIDTILEAQRMAVNIGKDLQEPEFNHSATIPLDWRVSRGDVVRLQPNDKMYTGAQQLAVQTITHSFGEKAETKMTLAGKPRVGFKRWLRLDSRPGVGEPPTIEPLQALTDAYGSLKQGIVRQFLDNTDYFLGGKYLQIRNSSFQQFTAGKENFPDGWSPASSETWGPLGTDPFYHDSESKTGSRSLLIRDVAGTNEIVSDLVPVDGDPNTPYSIELRWQKNTTATATLRVQVDWYDADRTFLSTTTEGTLSTGSLGVWRTDRIDGILPDNGSGAPKFLAIKLDKSAGDSDILVDTVSAFRTGRFSECGNILDGAPAGANYIGRMVELTNINDLGNNLVITHGGPFDPDGDYFLCRESGIYDISFATSTANGVTAGTYYAEIRAIINGTYISNAAGHQLSVGTTGAKSSQVGNSFLALGALYRANNLLNGSVFLNEGDKLSFVIDFYDLSSGGSYTINASLADEISISVKQRISD